MGGLRKTTARAALSQSRPPNSEKRSCKCSFISFHSPSSYIFIFFLFSSLLFPFFLNFHIFFRITLSVSQGVRQTKSFAIYGVFFIYSPQFSAPKLKKMSRSQEWRKFSKYKRFSLPEQVFFLHFVTEDREVKFKKTPCTIARNLGVFFLFFSSFDKNK